MSKIYKSSNLSPKSPLLWKFKRVPPQKGKDRKKDKASNEGDQNREETGDEEKMDEVVAEARAKAEKQAQEIIENAEKEKEKVLKKAEKDGYKEGYEKGKQEAMEEVKQKEEELLQEASHVLSAAKEEYNRLISELEPQVCQLVMRVGEKIINDKLENEKESIVEMVRNGLQKLADQYRVVIRAHPEDYAQINHYLETLNEEFQDVRLELTSDDKLSAGAPIIFGENGYIELGVAKQIEELRRALRQVMTYE